MDLKIKDVAELLNLSESTIRRWVLQKKIPSYQLNRRHLFSKHEIENWVLSNHPSPPTGEQGIIRGNSRGNQQFSLFRALHQGDILRQIHGRNKETIIREVTQKIAKYMHTDAEVMADLLLD